MRLGMRSDDPRLSRELLDGQELLVPSDDAWEELLASGELDGRPVGKGRIAAQYRALARATPGLFAAIGADLVQGKPWWVYLVVRLPDGLARVHVERQRCACGWSGATGNHRVLACYLGTDDPLGRMNARWDRSLAPCPQCGAALARPAVWTAPA